MRNKANPVRVLVVDDSLEFRQRLVALLATIEGVNIVAEAGDATSGLALFYKLRPDVLVLDIGLPGPSGITVLEAVRRETDSPIVIMLTNYNSLSLRDRCLELGADFYFYKADEAEKTFEVCRRIAYRRCIAASANGESKPMAAAASEADPSGQPCAPDRPK